MKKIIVALMLSMSVGFATSANAVDPSVAVLYTIGVAVGTQIGKPVPYNLTDACKAQSVKSETGNYSYTSFEHCLKK